jgi:hypothetical protein
MDERSFGLELELEVGEFVVVGIGVKKFENFKNLGRKRVLEKNEILYTDKKVLSSKTKTVK